ncbi:MAG: hypothetical protein ACRD1T_13670 [Acidimicrobiia bacterium]
MKPPLLSIVEGIIGISHELEPNVSMDVQDFREGSYLANHGLKVSGGIEVCDVQIREILKTNGGTV